MVQRCGSDYLPRRFGLSLTRVSAEPAALFAALEALGLLRVFAAFDAAFFWVVSFLAMIPFLSLLSALKQTIR